MSWPWNDALILREGYTEAFEPAVRRTTFDDGAIAQKKTAVQDWRLRTFEILVTESHLADFRSWLKSSAHTFFEFNDLDGNARQVRVRGGAGSVTLEEQPGRVIPPDDGSGTPSEAERYYSASVTLEGFDS